MLLKQAANKDEEPKLGAAQLKAISGGHRKSVDVRKSFTKDLHVIVKNAKKEQTKQNKSNKVMMGMLEKIMDKIDEEYEEESPTIPPEVRQMHKALRQATLKKSKPKRTHTVMSKPKDTDSQGSNT